jgi:hypothetical protein
MPVTEHIGSIGSGADCLSIPIVATTGRGNARPCPLRDICRSPLCKTSNADCPGSQKGN